MQGGQVRGQGIRSMKEEGWYQDPGDLVHHAEESGLFHTDTKKVKVEQTGQLGDNSNTPGNAAERPDLPLNNRCSSKNSCVHQHLDSRDTVINTTASLCPLGTYNSR